MSSEEWLYQITMEKIAELHDLTFHKLLDFRRKIKLPNYLAYTGTSEIQIDVSAFDSSKKVIVFSECKDFLTLQSAADCAEQLSMKSYLLRTSPPAKKIGQHNFDFANIENYQLLQYISLGSHSGTGYKNAKCSSLDELKRRLNYFSSYLNFSRKCHIGMLLYRDKITAPAYKMATPRLWKNIA